MAREVGEARGIYLADASSQPKHHVVFTPPIVVSISNAHPDATTLPAISAGLISIISEIRILLLKTVLEVVGVEVLEVLEVLYLV